MLIFNNSKLESDAKVMKKSEHPNFIVWYDYKIVSGS